jgi:hypothetical protein
MSLPFFKASLERSYRHASATSAPCLELLFVVLSLIVLHASLRFGLSSSWLVWPQSFGSLKRMLCRYHFAILGRMLCRQVARAVALPSVSLRSPLAGRSFAAVSVMAPCPRMLCRVDGR